MAEGSIARMRSVERASKVWVQRMEFVLSPTFASFRCPFGSKDLGRVMMASVSRLFGDGRRSIYNMKSTTALKKQLHPDHVGVRALVLLPAPGKEHVEGRVHASERPTRVGTPVRSEGRTNRKV